MPVRPLAHREIVVSGSTSNLGPGFDALGLALTLHLRIEILEARDADEPLVTWEFVGAAPPGENAIDRAYREALATFDRGPDGSTERPQALSVRVRSDIPMRAGLGSSAAAIVAGLRLAELIVGPQPIATLLSLACRLEGHPDNTSASLLGGLVAACVQDDGGVVARAVEWPAHWPIVVATPERPLETKAARAVLPRTVPFDDAVFNVQRTALLLHGVRLGDAAAVRDAMADRLHQPYRASLVPGLDEALSWSAPDVIGVFLSGAGPSIAAIADGSIPGSADAIRERFLALYASRGLGVTVRVLDAVSCW